MIDQRLRLFPLISMGAQTRRVSRIASNTRWVACIAVTLTGDASSQELDVPYVETPDDVIEMMLDMAQIDPADYVIDLGTGDGRLVIAAAKRGARGLGVDLDPVRIREAHANAVEAGVPDRVTFVQQDLFETDITEATVLLLFLNSEVNLRLRPALLANLKPGTRIVSHNFDMGDWQPDGYQQVLRKADGNFYIHDIYLWLIPADRKAK